MDIGNKVKLWTALKDWLSNSETWNGTVFHEIDPDSVCGASVQLVLVLCGGGIVQDVVVCYGMFPGSLRTFGAVGAASVVSVPHSTCDCAVDVGAVWYSVH